MLRPYCPYGCDNKINLRNLSLNKLTDITKEGIKVIVCPVCGKYIKVTTKYIPDYICRKVTILKKLKELLSLIGDWFGRPSHYV